MLRQRPTAIDLLRTRCIDAYDLVEQSPSAAAWAAYMQTTYADKLLAADPKLHDGTIDVVSAAYASAAACLDVARGGGGSVPDAPPHWRTPIRSNEQLAGMRDALEALRTYLAYELHDENATALARIDAERAKVERLWIRRPPPEIRGAIGSALAIGLDAAYALGRETFASR